MRADLRGFTLIEVLVALVVFVAVAMALDSTMGANVTSQVRFEEKTLATWVASNKLVEMQVYQKWPDTGRQDDETKFAGRDWFIATEVSEGPYPGTRRVDISVGPKSTATFDKPNPVATLTALLAKPEAVSAPAQGEGQKAGAKPKAAGGTP